MPADKPYKRSDGHGLFLEVKPNGTKTFRWSYRYASKQKTITIGRWGLVTLAEARAQRDSFRAILAGGKDPSLERRRQRRQAEESNSNTFRHVADLYIQKQKLDGRSKATLAKYQWFRGALSKSILDTPVHEVTRRQAADLVQTIVNAGTFEKAKRTTRFIINVIDHGIDLGYAEQNPTTRILKSLPTPTVTHQPAILDIDELGRLLFQVKHSNSREITKLAMMMLAYTAVRSSELRLATWGEIDLKASIWTIPPTRTKTRKEQRVPLSKQVLAILERLGTSGAHSELVFTLPHSKKPLSENIFTQRINKLGWKGKHSGHGFRSSFSSHMHAEGYESAHIEAALAHTDSNTVRAIYNRNDYLVQRVALMQDWANVLDEKIAKAQQAVVGKADT